MSKTYIDITPEIDEELAVWPGDRSFRRAVALDFKNGDHLVLSSFEATVHLGAHTDAPSHYHAQGESIEKRKLDFYVGLCQVIRVKLKRGERIRPQHLDGVSVKAPRILFHTGSYPNPKKWNDDFNSLSPELVHYLADQKVILVGIDTPSIDPASSKGLESHQAVYARNLAVLEGIVLDHVEPGEYELMALPLKIKGADASPVRAVLRPI